MNGATNVFFAASHYLSTKVFMRQSYCSQLLCIAWCRDLYVSHYVTLASSRCPQTFLGFSYMYADMLQ